LDGRLEECTQELIIEQKGDQILDVPEPRIVPETNALPAPALVIEFVAPARTATFDDPHQKLNTWHLHLLTPVQQQRLKK